MRRIGADAIVALLLLVLSAELYRETFNFRVPSFETMSTGTWPRIVLIALAALCIIMLMQSLLWPAPIRHLNSEGEAVVEPGKPVSHRNALICFGMFAAFLLSLHWLGMLIAGVAFVFLMQEFMGPRDMKSRVVHAAIAFVSVGGMWAVFTFALRVILPEGMILLFLPSPAMFFENVAVAFASVVTPYNLLLMAIGVLAGLTAGAIPGFTITMAVVLTLPFTFGMQPIEGLSTMIGVYVGALTGGLYACALIGIPGTPSAIATTFDAFPMARSGRAGLALGIGIWASFFAGIMSGVLLAVLAPTLALIGLEFGPWDYFMLVAFSLTMAASLSGEKLVKGLIAGVLGLLLASVGEDEINGIARFAYVDALKSGFDFLPVLVYIVR